MVDNSRVRDRLLNEYPPNTQGMWEILGEDPNCDLGGSHVQPKLEVVSGTYKNVVEYAITLRGFIGWGYGGSITLLNPPKGVVNVDALNNPEVLKLEEERRNIQHRLKTIESDLKALVQAPPPDMSKPKKKR